MRGPRLALASLLATAALLSAAAAASAQTTTTTPPVPPIPVTGGTTATTAAPTSTAADNDDLASTGLAADMLVPVGFALIGVGAVMQAAARRPRRAYGLL